MSFLYFFHDFSMTLQYDFDLHPTNTWTEMEKLVNKGLVKNIGLSNFNSQQIQDILDKGKVRSSTLIRCTTIHPI